ncbi:MAG: SoxR reducing system RseC family protein [Bacteroidia bacterium]|nr:SoxR reducing system RseC family protein [Bacteroidia bacterium]MBT8267878.1 SoxR reducing system RseC family protein [Bacteroidia bacterium]NNF83411.1 SoxR reducing system RseC family protein [Flavobacteriaceae bacterium]NNK69326.1 SoxR reducing system RseC family protein [Flavobacteriaceae bacterium]NNL79455.1 SoxR reducing system RseC family protein [Flavobacteriaceae bacterium]
MDSLVSHNTFIHSGTVSRISGDAVIVSLDENVHCDSCQIKSACGMSESRVKEVEVMNTDDSFSIHETVNVMIKKESAIKAVFWAYVFPFFLMLGVLLIASGFLPEWLAGLLALVVLLPYYIVLHYLDPFFKRTFNISVIKLV